MKWTKEMVENATFMAKQGMPYKDIATKLNIKAKNINAYLNRLGIKNTEYKILKKNVIKECLNCCKEIDGEKKFCDSKCSAIYNNKKRGKRTEEEKNNIKLGLIKSFGHNSIEDWEKSKENKNKIKNCKKKNIICKKCGNEICERPDICKFYFRNKNVFEKYLGFDSTKICTVEFYKEFDRIVDSLKQDYYINELSYSDFSIKYGMSTSSIGCLFNRLKITIRTSSESMMLAIKNGKMNYDNINNYPYKNGYHITWDNRKIHYRSSYELDYYKKLDELKSNYLVEKLKLKYYDTQKKRIRLAIPDIYIPDENLIIEIKSKWTHDEQNWIDRLKIYKSFGYKVKLIIGSSNNGLNKIESEIIY